MCPASRHICTISTSSAEDPAVYKTHGELCPAMKTLMPKLLASGEQPTQIRGSVDNSDPPDKIHRKVHGGFVAMLCWVGGIVQHPAMLESMNVEEMLVEAGYYQRQEALKMTEDMCCVCTEPGAVTACPGCGDTYCGQQCKKQDEEHHKQVCHLPWRACTDAEAELLCRAHIREQYADYMSTFEQEEFVSNVWHGYALMLYCN